MKTLYNLMMDAVLGGYEADIESIKVLDNANDTEYTFDSLDAVVDWYGESREVYELFSDSEPDENGYMEITLAA